MESGSRRELTSDLYSGQFLNGRIHVDGFRPIAELVTSVEIDMPPCDRGDLLE